MNTTSWNFVTGVNDGGSGQACVSVDFTRAFDLFDVMLMAVN